MNCEVYHLNTNFVSEKQKSYFGPFAQIDRNNTTLFDDDSFLLFTVRPMLRVVNWR
jgi:hypothetical protein